MNDRFREGALRRCACELMTLYSMRRIVLRLHASGLSALPSLARVWPTSDALREAVFWVTDCLHARRAKAAVAALRRFVQCSRMPYERVILGPRYSVRLEDIQASDAVDAECLGCDWKWRIAPHRLHDRYQGYVRLQQIGREMRCAKCGAGSAMVWNVVRASPK